MKMYFKPFLLFTTITASTFSQSFNKKNINNWIKEAYNSTHITQNTLYIINGIIIDHESLNSFSDLNMNDVSGITYCEKKSMVKIYCTPSDDGAILISLFDPSRKQLNYIRTDYKMFRKKINSNNPAAYPAVIINDKLIPNGELKTKIKSIKLKSILSFNNITTPINTFKYGKNAKNGLITIYTTKPKTNSMYEI